MTSIAISLLRPAGVCCNCFAVWQARRPRPPAVHCWHRTTVAKLIGGRWEVLENIGERELAVLRGLL